MKHDNSEINQFYFVALVNYNNSSVTVQMVFIKLSVTSKVIMSMFRMERTVKQVSTNNNLHIHSRQFHIQ